jgi:hypothetical protein
MEPRAERHGQEVRIGGSHHRRPSARHRKTARAISAIFGKGVFSVQSPFTGGKTTRLRFLGSQSDDLIGYFLSLRQRNERAFATDYVRATEFASRRHG